MSVICSFQEVSKSFRSGFLIHRKQVLDSISFEVFRGECFAYLGHNGAGKTTSIKSLLGLIRIDRGSISVMGGSPGRREVLGRVGYLPENPYFYDHLSAREFLHLVAELHGMDRKQGRRRTDELLELLSMSGRCTEKMRNYSKGMLQRIGLAQALINDPDLLILDEPMGGLDPVGRHQIRTILAEMKRQGKTIFLSSHILSDVEAIADRVAILGEGRVRRIVDLREMGAGHRGMEIQCRQLQDRTMSQLAEMGIQRLQEGDVNRLLLGEREHLPRALELILSSGAHLLQVLPSVQSLEEIYLEEVQEFGNHLDRAQELVDNAALAARDLPLSDHSGNPAPEARQRLDDQIELEVKP